ncbi:hypothetical protein C0993_001799 [Termitomyces sp. T159_Od127]|nr:hypothetical protein C0993_001799 [Termitomyces sp. T159_Od127]
MDFASLWARRTERSSGIRPEVRLLEEKVARVAAKKCSVEEVAALYRELDEWLESEAYAQTSLLLSSALLRAILMNHQAHSEASRSMKIVEVNLRAKIDELQSGNEKLEKELRSHLEINQTTSTICSKGTGLSEYTRPSAASPTPPSTSPTPYTSASSQSPLSRFNSMHQKSSSMSSRPTTPATPSPSRTYTPAPQSLLRTQTPAPLHRTQTPMVRPYTPAPTHSLRSMTQTPSHLRTTTPAPPPIPTKPRRLSTPSTPVPPKMVRSPSDEKAEIRQIWIPPGSTDPPLRTPSRSATRTPYTTASSRFSPR